MKQQFLIIAAAATLACGSMVVRAQQGVKPANAEPSPRPAATTTTTAAATAQDGSTPSPSSSRQQQQQQPPRSTGIDLTDYGVEFAPEPRLIVVMAALEAAGFNPAPAAATTIGGAQTSAFREMLRGDIAGINPDLRLRLQTFYQRAKLPNTATPAEQAARYVSLAYALGTLPGLQEPPRTLDLPDGVLEVLDFTPLVREFYRQPGIEGRMTDYVARYRAESDRLRRPTGEMVRALLSYLHTRPETTLFERVQTSSGDADKSKKKKDEPKRAVLRERARRFVIVPDLLAPSGVINFRVIGDDYFAIVPNGIDPANSDLRRAYLQYVIDPIIVRFNRDIAGRRADLKMLLDERAATGKDVTPDVFLAVSRSLVAATEARMAEAARLNSLTRETSVRLQGARDDETRARIVKESQETRAAVEDAATAQLADAYERGATLAFYFAEQLRGLESSGFDIRSSFADMIASFDVAKEKGRTAEYAAARVRHLARRKAQQELANAAAAAAAGGDAAVASGGTAVERRRATMIQSLSEVDNLLRAKNYTEAETRLSALSQDFKDEPRVHFALGQAASLSAQDAFDENLQAERLKTALQHYRMTVQTSTANPDPTLVSRAYAATGRILAFLERNAEALEAFDAAIKIGNVPGGAYNEAVAGRQKLKPE